MAEGTALLLGCGPIGAATAGLLGKDRAFRHLIIADHDLRRASAVTELCGEKAESAQVDCTDDASLRKVLADVSVVVNTIPLPLSETIPLIRNVVESGVSYVDSCDDPEVLQAVFESEYLESMAGIRAVSVVPGLGASPGLTNALTSYLGQRLERVEEAAFFLVDDHRRRTRRQWRERLMDFGSPALVWRDGDWRYVAPLSECSEVSFPTLTARVQCCVVGAGPVTVPGSFGTLERMTSHRGFVDQGMMEIVKNLVRYGFGSDEPVELPGGRISPREFAAELFSSRRDPWAVGLLSPALFPEGDPPGPVVRQAQIAGMLKGRRTRFTMTYEFPGEGDIDNAAATLAVGARMLMTREVHAPGVHAPEALDPAPFLWDMERRGVEIQLAKTYEDEA